MSCPDCVTGYHLAGEPVGSISTQGAYFTPAPPSEEGVTRSHAILLLTDAFGLPLKNSKLIADELASRLRCDVWAPDLFNGRPLVPLKYVYATNTTNAVKPPWWKWPWIRTTRAPYYYMSRPSVVDARLAKFITAIKAEKKYTSLGAIGHCYGGLMAVRLAATDDVQTVVICHPAYLSEDMIKAIKVPNSWVCAEEDQFFPESKREEAEALLTDIQSKRGAATADFEFAVYKGMIHGFACRPDLNVPAVKEAYEDALDQAVKWFQKTLLHETLA